MDAWTQIRQHVLAPTDPKGPHWQNFQSLSALLNGTGSPEEWRNCLNDWKSLSGSGDFRKYLLGWTQTENLGLSEDNVDAFLMGLEDEIAGTIAQRASSELVSGNASAGRNLYDLISGSSLGEHKKVKALNATVHVLAERLRSNVRQARETLSQIPKADNPEPVLQGLTTLIEAQIWPDVVKLKGFDAPESITARDETCVLFVGMGQLFSGPLPPGAKSMWDLALEIAPSEITRNAIKEVMPKGAGGAKRPWWKVW